MNPQGKPLEYYKHLMHSLSLKKKDFEVPAFASFIDNARFPVNFVDRNGVITYANKAARETDIIPDEFVGQSLHDLKKLGLILNPAALKVLQTRKVNIGEVTQYSGRTFMSITVPVIDDRGTLDGVLALTCDIQDVYNFIIASSSRTRHLQTGSVTTSELVGDPLVPIAESDKMRNLVRLVDKIAPTSAPVLILGESGTGKEIFARCIHARSQRSARKLLAVNCGAIPATLMESELFGYEKGAFTGALRGRQGLFEAVDGGTLFLDEIGDLDLHLQVQLLRVLQEGTFRRVGGQKEITCNVRIIAATNKDLARLVSQGQFREDLFYRLNVFSLSLPPLRDRREDLVKLIPFFLEKYNRTYGCTRYLNRDAWTRLLTYSWPGNVRELSNVLERLVVLADNNEITSATLENLLGAAQTRKAAQTGEVAEDELFNLTLPEAIESLERKMLVRAKEKFRTCRAMAEHLGIEYSTVARKMRKYGLEKR